MLQSIKKHFRISFTFHENVIMNFQRNAFRVCFNPLFRLVFKQKPTPEAVQSYGKYLFA